MRGRGRQIRRPRWVMIVGWFSPADQDPFGTFGDSVRWFTQRRPRERRPILDLDYAFVRSSEFRRARRYNARSFQFRTTNWDILLFNWFTPPDVWSGSLTRVAMSRGTLFFISRLEERRFVDSFDCCTSSANHSEWLSGSVDVIVFMIFWKCVSAASVLVTVRATFNKADNGLFTLISYVSPVSSNAAYVFSKPWNSFAIDQRARIDDIKVSLVGRREFQF